MLFARPPPPPAALTYLLAFALRWRGERARRAVVAFLCDRATNAELLRGRFKAKAATPTAAAAVATQQ